MQEAQQAVELKRQRSERSVADSEESFEKSKQKEEEMSQKLDLFNSVLLQITAPLDNRPEKREDDSWLDHFKRLVGCDIPEAPAAFSSSSLTYQQVLVKLAQHIGYLTSQMQKAKNAAFDL